MANTVFEAALAAMAQAMGAVEAELTRLAGIEQRIGELTVQRNEMQVMVNGLAGKIAEARKTVADSEVSAGKIIEEANRLKAKIIQTARANAEGILEEADKAAAAIRETARNEVTATGTAIEAAKRELSELHASIAAAQTKLDVANATLAQMKKSARAFAEN